MGVQTSELAIIVRARDQATKALSRIRGGVAKFATSTRKRFDSVKKSVFSLKGAFVGLAAGAFIRSTVKAFQVQTKAVAGMEQAMKSMGRFTPQLSKDMQALAAEIQNVGISGDEAVIEGTKFLMTYRQITDDLMPDAIKAMADLSALTGGDMAQSANILGKAAMGMTGMLARYGITLSETAKKSKDFKIILGEITEQVGGQQRALREAAGGDLQALANTYGDLKEQIGGLLVTGIIPLVTELSEEMADWQINTEESRETMLDFMEGLVTAAGMAADGLKVMGIGVLELGKAGNKAYQGWLTWSDKYLDTLANAAAFWGQESLSEKLFKGSDRASKALKGMATDQKLFNDEIERLKQGKYAEEFKGWFVELRKAAATKAEVRELTGELKEYGELIMSLEAFEDAAFFANDPTLGQYDEDIRKVNAEIGLLITKLNTLGVDGLKIWKGIAKGMEGTDEWTLQIHADNEKLIEDQKKLEDAVRRRAEAEKELADAARQGAFDAEQKKILSNYEKIHGAVTSIANVIADNIVGAIDAAQQGTLSWRKALTQTVQDLSRMLIGTALRAGISLLAGGIAGAAAGSPSVIPPAPSIPSRARGGFIPPPVSAAKGMLFRGGPQLIQVADNKEGTEVMMPVGRGADGVMGVRGRGGGDTILNFNGMPDAHSARAAYMMVSEDIGQDIQRQREERGL